MPKHPLKRLEPRYRVTLSTPGHEPRSIIADTPRTGFDAVWRWCPLAFCCAENPHYTGMDQRKGHREHWLGTLRQACVPRSRLRKVGGSNKATNGVCTVEVERVD